MVMLGDTDIAVAGGAESMSRAPYSLPNMRWGKRLGDGAATDMLVATLTDPFGNGHIGVTAENVAAEQSITREAQDQFALISHQRATKAIAEGRFKDQIVSVTVKAGRETKLFDVDEHVRSDARKPCQAPSCLQA